MPKTVKIAIVGDFNFTYNAHHATNLSLEHTEHFLEIDINYYWIRTQEAATYGASQFEEFDGIWIAPGPFLNLFYLSGILRIILTLDTPVFVTGEAYKDFVELQAKLVHNQFVAEKVISDNMLKGDLFEGVEIIPSDNEIKQFYTNHSRIELTSCRYSIYPSLLNNLTKDTIDILAYNQFEEPELLRLKNHPFCLVNMFCPQISSTREMPHPLINSFLKTCIKKSEGLFKNG